MDGTPSPDEEWDYSETEWWGWVVLVVTWIVGFLNALMHARDAWAGMPTGLVLSVIVVVLASLATWLGFANARIAGRKA